jgi:6-phosphogluconolactonase
MNGFLSWPMARYARRLRFALAAAILVFHVSAFAMSSHLIFVGTYTKSGSRGIYAVRLDSATGALSEPVLVAETSNPTWITFSPDKKFLYAANDSEARAVGFTVDAKQMRLTPLPATPTPAAINSTHLAVDATGRTLVLASYQGKFLGAVPIRADGTLGAPILTPHEGRGAHPTRQTDAHPHSVTLSPDNRFVIACDLGLDKIFTYALDPTAAKLTPGNPPFVATKPGAGPRHFKFGVDGKHAYAINELDNTITVYNYAAANGALTPRQTLPTLPADFSGANTTAEVRVHPNGKFLYGSNRGHDSIAVFAIAAETGLLTPVEIVSSGGKTPRNFALSPDGAWLVCGHQNSDSLIVFRVDPATGKLTRMPGGATVPQAVCVLFHD